MKADMGGSWIVSGASLTGAALFAAVDDIQLSDNARVILSQLGDIFDEPARSGLTWRDWAVWFAGINGLAWNPWVQRLAHLGIDAAERQINKRVGDNDKEPDDAEPR